MNSSRMNLFYWECGSGSAEDKTNYPLFQSYANIDPERENGCGSAAINCLTQASHGQKMAHEKGPMLYNATNPTGGAVGVATTTARVFAGIFTLGLSEAVITPTLNAIFSQSKPILKSISEYSVTPGNTMRFLEETIMNQDPVLILFDKGPNKFHWVCCCGYIQLPGHNIIYVCNDWGNSRLISHETIDQWTSATLDNFVAVKSNRWRIGYKNIQDQKCSFFGRDFHLRNVE